MLIDADLQIRDRPSAKQAVEWNRRVDEWIKQDKRLETLITRFRELRKVQPKLGTLTRDFRERAKRHLIDADLRYSLEDVANGNPYFRNIVKIMPEIDPQYRIDQPYQRWKYLLVLNEYRTDTYHFYEKQWRAKIEKWLAAKPDLAELLPEFRDVWPKFRASQALLEGPIAKHLHDVNDLSLPIVQQFKLFLEGSGIGPSTELVRALLPDVRSKLAAQQKSNTQRSIDWGFDGSVLSPFTGKLMPEGLAQFQGYRDQWRDASVLAELEQPIPRTRRRRVKQYSRPAVFRFNTSLKPNTSATVTIDYELQLGSLVHLQDSGGFRGGTPELVVLCPSKTDVPVILTVVPDFQLLVFPAPSDIKILEDGRRQLTTKLTSKSRRLHVMSVRLDGHSNAFLGRFNTHDLQVQADLARLMEKNSNPTVKPLLMTAMYHLLLNQLDGWKAHRIAKQIEQQHPDFMTSLKKLRSHWYRAREARELFEWIEAKSESPSLQKKKNDFRRFRTSSSNQMPLNPDPLQELALRVGKLDAAKLDINEKLGQRFILSQAGIDTQENLTALLKLAKSNPAQTVNALRLIQFLTIGKSAALPFVLDQIDLDMRARLRAKTVTSLDLAYLEYTEAYYAMGTFRSPKHADQLIRFIQSTPEGILIQGAITALSKMTLPDHFDELKEIADTIAGASESGFIQYLNLLLRSDRDKAIPFLEELAKRHAKLAPRVMSALGRTHHRIQLAKAIEIYRASKDTQDNLTAAIGVLREQAAPSIIAKLKYRQGLPKWMNEALVSAIRARGGDKSNFAFVEKFYHEFVKGKKAQQHLTCVAAFEKIGDPRAIPYLREIVKSTERKPDAAHAIGSLLLDKAVPRKPVDTSTDEYVRTVMRAGKKEIKAAAWKGLLKDHEKSIQRMLKYGPLRETIASFDRDWSPEDRARMAFIGRFGDVATKHLLHASSDCSLERRYQIARLLEIMLPDSKQLIEAVASNPAANDDTKRTAQLAIELYRLRKSSREK